MNSVIRIGPVPALWKAFYADSEFFPSYSTTTYFEGFTVAMAARPHLDRDTPPILVACFIYSGEPVQSRATDIDTHRLTAIQRVFGVGSRRYRGQGHHDGDSHEDAGETSGLAMSALRHIRIPPIT
jgi:hypothetical protein